MKSKYDEKAMLINDEIRFVSHMHNILKNGLLGRDEPMVLGEEPTKRFFSGVLFPDASFIDQLDTSGETQDPQPVFRSIAKNCNIGLEFLLKHQVHMHKIKISGSFKLYLRVFPSFNEQMRILKLLESTGKKEVDQINDEENIEEDVILEDSEPEQLSKRDQEVEIEYEEDEESNDIPGKDINPDKGLKLLQKYRCIEVCFKEIPIAIDSEHILEVDLSENIGQALNNAIGWEDIFCVKSELIDHTSNVSLVTRPENEEEFKTWLISIKGKSITVPEWISKLNIEARPYLDEEEDVYRVVVSMVNKTKAVSRDDKPTGHALEFFDCQLQVDILDETLHVPFEFDGAPRDYKYDKRLDVKGINCVGLCDEQKRTVFVTECVPDYFQPLYRTREDLKVRFNDLTDPESTIRTLTDIVSEMNRSLMEWKLYVNSMGDADQPLKNNEELKLCEQEMREFEEEIKSFELGIYCLAHRSDNRLMKAFNTMNMVFSEAGKGKYDSWRLFQIVFVVRILPSLFAREVDEIDPKYSSIIDSSKYADILWFPTGGGKTEAYLGLIVCALFYDRLRGKYRGCTGWLRFPLRMLSKNQLDRLMKILIFAEKIREGSDEFNGRGGEIPFSVGFFAGGGNTPNFIRKKDKDIIFSSDSKSKKLMLLHKCPICSSPLTLDFNEKRWRVVHKCTNENCFVFKSTTLKGVLPIYITDSEIYRFVPNVLCGTVDKLSIMARYREFTHLFGQIVGKCDNHGYFSDNCIIDKMDDFENKPCGQKTSAAMKKKVALDRQSFYDPVPSLLIQDELHLLKEELGALDGHYEGALNEFSTIFGGGKEHLPKIVAATATIESYKRHIEHLYLRRPRRYPSMGYKYGESFYATSSPMIKRRLYIGVLSHSKSFEEVIGHCLYLYHKEIYRLYYHSKIEWNNFEFEAITDERKFLNLLAMYDLSVEYVNKKAVGDDIKRRINEYTNEYLRKDTNQDFDLQSEILTGHTNMESIVGVIDRIESECKSEYKDKLHTLIATSLISHGVDLERVNAFFMAGMPSKQAEYIQASSRSARNHAGLVLVCFKANDLRERSQYQYFIQNHIFMDRLVDPVPINRVSLKVIKRSLPGLLCALLLGVHSQQHSTTISDCNNYLKYIADANVRGRSAERELVSQLKSIIGTKSGIFSKAVCEKVDKFIESEFEKWHHILCTSSGNIKGILNPITSFRDIEEGIELSANTDTAIVLSMLNRK